MRRLGKVLHLSRSGNLILRLENPELPSIGATARTYKMEIAGVVNGVFGPVKAPYVSVRVNVETANKLLGRVLYTYDKE